MRKTLPLILLLILATGCAASFKEKRARSRPIVNLAIHKIQEDNPHSALIDLVEAKKANPRDPEVYYYTAYAYNMLGNPDKAIENINKAIALGDLIGFEHPGMKGDACNLKGDILFGQGKKDKAIKAFEDAFDDDLFTKPEYALYNIGNVYISMHEDDEAQKAYKQALEYNSHYTPAWIELTGIYTRKGDYASAIECLRHAILESPNYPEAHWELAMLYIKTGNTTKAAEHLEKVIHLDPGKKLARLAVQRLKDITDVQ